MTDNFQSDYSDIYDKIYSVKDYGSEAQFIQKLLHRFSGNVATILDLGCGTGNHARYLKEFGFIITGIDKSESMIESAKTKLPDSEFLVKDIGNLDLGKSYDAVISLFHVLSYQVAEREVEDFFRTVKLHLDSGGVAIIDFWYAPAVLKMKPEIKDKTHVDGNVKIRRTAVPEKIIDKPAYKIKVTVEVSVDGKVRKRFDETHVMRYFHSEEISRYAANAGLRVIYEGCWAEDNKRSDENSWSAFMVLTVI